MNLQLSLKSFDEYQTLVDCKNDEQAISKCLKTDPRFIMSKKNIPTTKYYLLLNAVYNGLNLIATQLVKHGWDPTKSYKQIELAAILPLQLGNTELFLSFLDIIAEKNLHFTLSASEVASRSLSLAVYQENVDVVCRLLKLKPDIDYLGDDVQKTALIRAASNGHYELVEILVKAGATIDKTDRNKRTALAHALNNAALSPNMPKIIKFLLDNGASKKIVFVEGSLQTLPRSYKSYLGEALSFCILHSLDETNDNGPNDNKSNNSNNSKNTLKDTLKDNFLGLIEIGAPVDWLYNAQNETILFQAIRLKKISFVEKLLKAGAEINHQNDKLHTPLICAIKSFIRTKNTIYWQIIDLLLLHGAVKTIKGKDGKSFLNYANEILGEAVYISKIKNIRPSIKVGADIKNGCANLYTYPLTIIACKNGNLQVIAELIKFMPSISVYKMSIQAREHFTPDTMHKKIALVKLFRGHLYGLAGLMLFRAFPKDIAREINEMLVIL